VTRYAETLGDLLDGLCVDDGPRKPACAESRALIERVGLPRDTPVAVLHERWTPLAAAMLAHADGAGPRVDAVVWVDSGLGTAVLRHADLRGADLRGAALGDANLWCADLRDADLRAANLWGANLWGAELRDANLRHADLGGADLRDADLQDADLQGANLRHADIEDADLWGARADVTPPGWRLDDNGRLVRGAS